MRILTFLKELPKYVKVQLWLLLILPLNFLLVFLADLFPNTVESIYSNGFFSTVVRGLSIITGILPFSLAEVLVITAVIFAVTVFVLWIRKIIVTVKEKGRVWTLVTDYLTRALSILFCGIFLFNLLYGFSYYRKNTTAYVYDKYVKYLAAGLTNMVNIFQPEIISLGGGVSNEGQSLIDALAPIVHQEQYGSGFLTPVKLRIAELGNDAGMIGAAMM